MIAGLRAKQNTPDELPRPSGGGAVRARGTSIGLLLVASSLWGSSFVVIKLGLEGAPPVTSAALRFAVAAAASLAVLRAFGPVRRAVFLHPIVLLLSVLNTAGFILQYLGLNGTNSAAAALLANVAIVLVPVLSSRLLDEKVTARVVVAVAFALTGGSLVATRGDLASVLSPDFRADLMMLAASVMWFVFIVYNKVASASGVASDPEITFAVLGWTAVLSVPAAVAIEGVPTLAYTQGAWASILYTGVFCSSLAFLVYMRGLRGVTATVSGVVLLSEIIAALVLTAVVFGIVLTGAAALGAALIVLGILLVSAETPASTPPARGEGLPGKS